MCGCNQVGDRLRCLHITHLREDSPCLSEVLQRLQSAPILRFNNWRCRPWALNGWCLKWRQSEQRSSSHSHECKRWVVLFIHSLCPTAVQLTALGWRYRKCWSTLAEHLEWSFRVWYHSIMRKFAKLQVDARDQPFCRCFRQAILQCSCCHAMPSPALCVDDVTVLRLRMMLCRAL